LSCWIKKEEFIKIFAKASKKGQVTIPKPLHEKLKIGDHGGVLFLIEDDAALLPGVSGARHEELAGLLKRLE